MPTAFEVFQRAVPQFERAFGVQVRLRSGDAYSAEFTATYVDKEYESVELETGLPIKIVGRDFFVAVEHCVINDLPVEPRRGMYVLLGNSTYEILPQPGRPSAELQADGKHWLVHTKEVT